MKACFLSRANAADSSGGITSAKEQGWMFTNHDAQGEGRYKCTFP